MKKSKILAITGAFVPFNDTVTLLSYKHLRRMNIETEVIALKTIEDESIKKEIEKDAFFKKCKIEYISDYTDTIASLGNKNIIKCLVNVLRYCKVARKRYFENNHELIYTSSLPAFTHLAGYFIKKKSPNAQWIASFSDPLLKSPYKYDTETFNEYNLIGKIGFLVYIFIYMNGLYERLAFKYADKLVFICDEQRDFMIRNHRNKDALLSKSYVIPLNYIDGWSMYDDLKTTPNVNKKQLRELVHMGRIYGLRDFTAILLAVSELKKEIPNLSQLLQIHQYGEFLERYHVLVNKLDIQDIIKVHDKVPYEEALKLMKEADGLILMDTILKNEAHIQPYLPSKMLEYGLINKPLLAVANEKSPTFRMLKEVNYHCCKNEIKDIQHYLSQFIVDAIKAPFLACVENADILDLNGGD